jgi:hypothetical protein
LSRAILAYFMALEPVELARVRHPNDLVYRLHFHPTRIEASHFVGGEGPLDGLLHRSDNETISRLEESEDQRDR